MKRESMDRLIRIGVPNSGIYESKALTGVRYIHRNSRDIKTMKVSVKNPDDMFEALIDHRADMVVTEYEKLLEYDSEIQNILTIGLVLPQGDTRDVLVTLKKAHNRFDYPIVECHSSEAVAFVEHTYDGVNCRASRENDALQLNRILSSQCDAAVLSADRVRSLKLDRNRHLRYTYFKNRYDNAGTKAVWVAVIRKDDDELSEILMPMSDRETLRHL
jgi:porphobilinogen deaminase